MRATVTERLLAKLKRKPYRASYVANEVRLSLAHQIRALRVQRGWSQADLADRMGTKQSVVSRLENPDYDKVGLQSVLDAADAFDVAFVGRYCAFDEMLFRQRDVSPDSFRVESFNPARIMAQCEIVNARPVAVTSDLSNQKFNIVGALARVTEAAA